MNPVLWASMKDLETLQCVERMIPNYVKEEDLELLRVIRKTKDEVLETTWLQDAIANGGALTAVGIALLMIPEPVVFAVGFWIGGPIGGYVAMVVVNILGFSLIILDQFI